MAGTTGRILIVDDEPDDAILIERVALQIGFKVLTIYGSDQFEKALQQFIPTIIFLDIAMPGRDGMALVGVLAASGYPGKVVIMSGDPAYIQMSAAIAKTRGLMMTATLSKPFWKQSVLDLLESLADLTQSAEKV